MNNNNNIISLEINNNVKYQKIKKDKKGKRRK